MKFYEITGKMSAVGFLVPLIDTEFNNEEYSKRIIEIGKAICDEKNLDFESFKAADLPGETELTSENVISLFQELNQWLETQNIYESD